MFFGKTFKFLNAGSFSGDVAATDATIIPVMKDITSSFRVRFMRDHLLWDRFACFHQRYIRDGQGMIVFLIMHTR